MMMQNLIFTLSPVLTAPHLNFGLFHEMCYINVQLQYHFCVCGLMLTEACHIDASVLVAYPI